MQPFSQRSSGRQKSCALLTLLNSIEPSAKPRIELEKRPRFCINALGCGVAQVGNRQLRLADQITDPQSAVVISSDCPTSPKNRTVPTASTRKLDRILGIAGIMQLVPARVGTGSTRPILTFKRRLQCEIFDPCLSRCGIPVWLRSPRTLGNS